MERAKLDHHHHKQQHPLQGSSVAAPAAPFPVGTNLAWNSIVLLKGEDSSTSSGVGGDCRDSSVDPTQGYGPLVPPSPLSTSMVHELGIHWPCSADTSNQQGHLAKSTAEELPDSLLKLANFGSVWNPWDHPSPSTICNKYVQQGSHDKDLGLLCEDRLQFSATGRHHAVPSPYASSFGGDAAAASEHLGSYSKLLLATNTPSSSSFPISFSMQELQALELLASARFGDILRQPSLCNVAFYGEGVACGLGGHLPLPHPGPSNELQKISSLLDGDTEGKRANTIPEHKASPPATKKPRTEPRLSSMSPLKVRKEKLGDRVAALQQLVAPFGKTDTASVLTEAVGYIKFLQEQVQTLSMPYLRSSNKSKIRTAQGVSSKDKDEIKQDLRSRGLCLVPLSYTTFFSSEGGSAWSPPCFRGIEM